MPSSIPQPIELRVQNTNPTRPTPVVPPVRVSLSANAIPPVVTSPALQSTLQGQEMPDAIVVQDRSNSSPQSKNEQQPPVRSAEEALKILDNHRNQNGEVTPINLRPPAPSQTIVIQVKPKTNTAEDSTISKTSPTVRSAEEALQILKNHRNKTQAANSKPYKSVPAKALANTGVRPVNLPNEKAPSDTLDEIVAKLKVKHNPSLSFNAQKALADADVVYVVQIAALINRRDVNHKVFRGLSGLSTEKFREFHRYLYSPTASYQQAKIAQQHVISKGFTKAFIVAYVNGTRTSAWEVAKLNNQN